MTDPHRPPDDRKAWKAALTTTKSWPKALDADTAANVGAYHDGVHHRSITSEPHPKPNSRLPLTGSEVIREERPIRPRIGAVNPNCRPSGFPQSGHPVHVGPKKPIAVAYGTRRPHLVDGKTIGLIPPKPKDDVRLQGQRIRLAHEIGIKGGAPSLLTFPGSHTTTGIQTLGVKPRPKVSPSPSRRASRPR